MSKIGRCVLTEWPIVCGTRSSLFFFNHIVHTLLILLTTKGDGTSNIGSIKTIYRSIAVYGDTPTLTLVPEDPDFQYMITQLPTEGWLVASGGQNITTIPTIISSSSVD